MKCDQCDREATVRETIVRNGVKVERHLCEACAAKQGILPTGANPAAIHELIKHFVVAPSEGLTAVVPPAAQPKRLNQCPACGMTFAEFKQHGLLGCAECYQAFEGQLLGLLERAHEGGQHHVGKIPKRLAGAAGEEPEGETRDDPTRGLSMEERAALVQRLRGELERAVREERYELAAQLRDALKQTGGGMA